LVTFDHLNQNRLVHGLTTKVGGITPFPYENTMNLFATLYSEAVLTNIKMAIDELKMKGNIIVATKQVHSDHILKIKDKKALNVLPSIPVHGTALSDYQVYYSDNTDGLITSQSGIILMTFFADCTPLLLFDSKNNVVASVHSGWRGTTSKIGVKALEILKKEYRSNQEDILIGIGPCASDCCYEVDYPVIEAFSQVYSKTIMMNCVIPVDYGKYKLDLKNIIAMDFYEKGITKKNIEICADCTICKNNIYHSHRAAKGGERGTMAMFVEI